MSGSIVIYDRAGVDPICLSATYRQIKDLVDDRSYRIEYLSEISLNRGDPVRLIVVPGGNYLEMETKLRESAPAIRKLILDKGTHYMGICAGAIAAACDPLLFSLKPRASFHPHDSDKLEPAEPQEMVMARWKEMPLRLYSGGCAAFDVPDRMFHGTQRVRKITPESLGEKLYNLYFQNGVFFPGATKELNTCPLLTFDSFTFSGYYEGEAKPIKRVYYEKERPVAALTHQVGKGLLLLSGVHPEIGPEDVRNSPVKVMEKLKKDAEKAQALTLESLSGPCCIIGPTNNQT
jgi:glutamine amidotransferase-like uncharacterized protein